MARYKPTIPFSVPLMLLEPQYQTKLGVTVKSMAEKGIIYAAVRTFGGTERDVNGVYSIEATANIETWFRPDITSECHLRFENGDEYEILGEPENIEMRNQFLKFKVRKVKGNV